MRSGLLLTAALLFGCSCSGFGDSEEQPAPPITKKMVADGTPYIVGLLGHSPDTTFHHPEVYVGRLSDPMRRDYDLYEDREAFPPTLSIWDPVLWSQVVNQCSYLRLRTDPDPTATVSVTGPLEQPGEQTVTFVHERDGVYGDVGSALVIRPLGRYRLDVRLADGRRYGGETTMLGVSDWPQPARNVLPLKRISYHDWDGLGEMSIDGERAAPFTTPSGSGVTVVHRSWDLDYSRELYILKEGEQFWFEEKGPYFREAAHFRAMSSEPEFREGFLYIYSANSRTFSRRDSVSEYRRVTHVNRDMLSFYTNEHFRFGTFRRDSLDIRHNARLDARYYRDSTYLPRVTTLYKVGADGRPLPKADLDAVGVFGAHTSRYKKIRHVFARDYDACTVWPGTRCRDGSISPAR